MYEFTLDSEIIKAAISINKKDRRAAQLIESAIKTILYALSASAALPDDKNGEYVRTVIIEIMHKLDESIIADINEMDPDAMEKFKKYMPHYRFGIKLGNIRDEDN